MFTDMVDNDPGDQGSRSTDTGEDVSDAYSIQGRFERLESHIESIRVAIQAMQFKIVGSGELPVPDTPARQVLPPTGEKETTPAESLGKHTDVVDFTEEQADDALLRKAADDAQKICPFDPVRLYDTLTNPSVRSRHELKCYVESAIENYTNYTGEFFDDLFMSDFRFWTESHFVLISKQLLAKRRELLIQRNVKIRKVSFIQVSKALSEHIAESVDRLDAESSVLRTNEKPPGIPAAPLPSVPHELHADRAPPHPVSKENKVPSQPVPPDKHGARADTSQDRPGDVSKYFTHDMKYGGYSRGPLRRKYILFCDAVELSVVDEQDNRIVLKLI